MPQLGHSSIGRRRFESSFMQGGYIVVARSASGIVRICSLVEIRATQLFHKLMTEARS
jgi:hypothetical protein